MQDNLRTVGAIRNNLKSWNFRVQGKINLDEAEKTVLCDALERLTPQPVKLDISGDVYGWHERAYTCPNCEKELGRIKTMRNEAQCPVNYCPNCGQSLIRAKQEA